ncbi:MAG: hypothetical protein QM204_01930 [Bacillota bacterium]|jgi:hypothetical protein|nr:hypothetical protein [Bacillota bacterium]NLL26132.1 hypothetical protein [Erysipelotrichia bacterium]
MKLKKVGFIGFAIFIISSVVFVIGLAAESVPLMIVGGLIYILFIFYIISNSKCPYCGNYIKNSSWKHCPHCGKEL